MSIELEEAIYKAVVSCDVPAVKELLTNNPELRDVERPTGTWLLLAVIRSDHAMVDLLYELGVDMNHEMTKGRKGNVALDPAIRKSDVEMLAKLLKYGAKPTRRRQILAAVTSDNSLEIVKLLEEYGADIHQVFTNEFTGESMNALSHAIDYGKQDLVEYLLSRGAVMPDAPSPDSVPGVDENDVVGFFRRTFGEIDSRALIEIVPTEPPITVHCVPPGEGRDCVTLFTSGMSAEGLNVPNGAEEFRHNELMIQLPSDWDYRVIEDPQLGWPVHFLRLLAKYPHQLNTWLGGPVCVVANGDPPEPIAPNSGFSAMLLLVTPHQFKNRDGNLVRVFQMFPLFDAERQLDQKMGSHALMKALDDAKVSFVVDMGRESVA